MKKAMNQSKLILILNTISIAGLILVFLLVFLNSRFSNDLTQASEDRFALTENANLFMDGSAYLTNEVRAYAATGNKVHYDNYMTEVNTTKRRETGLAKMQEIGITPAEQSLLDQMADISNGLVSLEENAMANVEKGQTEAATKYVYGDQYTNSLNQISILEDQFLDDLSARTLSDVNSLNRKSVISRITIFLALLLVAGMQLFVMRVVRKDVLTPVQSVCDQMIEISKGNLSADFKLEPDSSEIGMLVASIHETKRELKNYIQDIDSHLAQMAQGNMDLTIGEPYRGEFLPIQDAMRQILDSLNHALSQIGHATAQVTMEAEQMASDSQILSSGAVTQASTVQQLSANIQSLSGEVKKNSGDAGEARRCSEDAAKQLTVCNQKMVDLTTAMENISKSSQQINGIIKTIEDISFQTNILALNASVEAARAGAAGKGFAVVANEVQSLANKSAAAAQNITGLINESLKLVSQGTSLTADTTAALETSVAGAQKSTKLIEQIAASAMQQSEALDQLTLGMEQISQVIQTNASTAEKSASSAQQLHDQATKLKASVQHFHLREDFR